MTYKVLDRLVYIDVSTFIQLDLLARGCLVQGQLGSRFCNRHGDEAGDVADCFSLRWFYFRVSSLKINNIAPEKARFIQKILIFFLFLHENVYVVDMHQKRRGHNICFRAEIIIICGYPLYVKFSLFCAFMIASENYGVYFVSDMFLIHSFPFLRHNSKYRSVVGIILG